MDDPGRCGWDERQHRGKRSERRGRNNQHDTQGCQAYRWSDLDPIHEHHMGPRRMHAALERPDIRQYLTACHELFKFLLALQGASTYAPCTFSFHSAFKDPASSADAPDRWSIEVRCMVIYD